MTTLVPPTFAVTLSTNARFFCRHLDPSPPHTPHSSSFTGDPMIYSEANGFKFQILFYECDKGKDCSSLQFVSYFGAEDDNTPEYANAWNAKTRFIRASVEKKELQLAYDITTTGGLNKANFTDVLEWWSAMLGEFALFVKEKKAL